MVVATTPTVYGIETFVGLPSKSQALEPVATTPTVYGIETVVQYGETMEGIVVATTPTVYGIETIRRIFLLLLFL